MKIFFMLILLFLATTSIVLSKKSGAGQNVLSSQPDEVKVKEWFRKDGILQVYDSEKKQQRAALEIEIVSVDVDRAQGLMYRDFLAPLHGMLFIFKQPALQSFHMKNTKIALDMIFLDADKKIVTIHESAKPYDLTPISSKTAAQFVIETNAGFCKKFRIGEGDVVSFARIGE